MQRDDHLRPGLVLGAYPEQSHKDDGFVERQFNALLAWFKQTVPSRGFMAKRFVKRVALQAPAMRQLSDEALAALGRDLQQQLHRDGLVNGLIAQSFALVREIAQRKLSMFHYPPQIIGGYVILKGMIAEMETGEGKTLMATLPACTAALAGIPVHIITVNEYLVKRDAEWMKPIYEALGLSVGYIMDDMNAEARRSAYRCDITYCTNKQVTFDYLRDRLQFGGRGSPLQYSVARLQQKDTWTEQLHLRGLCFGIVDEADSVLVDECRTPLILSREITAKDQRELYDQALAVVRQLDLNVHFTIYNKTKQVELTQAGQTKTDELTIEFGGLWKGARRRQELVRQAISALHLFQRDQHYLIREKKICVIDEFTGRVLPDRAWEYGLHQMIEAKENCEISSQKETLARISYQQFFRRYLKLGGMTGTAQEITGELWSVYRLGAVKVPTYRPVQRKKLATKIFRTKDAKWQAIIRRVEMLYQQGRPVLVGTTSVAISEYLGGRLHERNIPHQILNARHDATESNIIAKAGEMFRITVATNMAGRGTDIKLAPEVRALGGLHVIATECHEAGRIDRQLFGRCGRQGDPGSHEIMASLEDELIQRFGPKLRRRLYRWVGRTHKPIPNIFAHSVLTHAQQKAERHHARIRRDLLKFDNNLENALAFSGKAE